jgi:signal transduction histidine kinase
MIDSILGRTSNPLWWRIPAWSAITAATVFDTHSVTSRIVAGVLIGTAAVAMQFLRHSSVQVRRAAVLVATACGLAACYASPGGLAAIPVIMASYRAADAFGPIPLRWFVILNTVAFGGTIAYISSSLAGALAGLGVPLVVQRSVEHRDLVRERDRAQALLAEVQAGREAEAQAAALRERGRIARDLHDVLAHSLAGLSVQLQAVRAVAGRENVGDTVLVPLDKAAALAREGLGEARAAVSALRDPIGLGLDALPALVERHPGEATLTIGGTPGLVSAEAGHAIYRAVQESLTNAARYAPGSPVSVALRWSGESLEVTVIDSGPAPERSAVAGQGTGLGLAGMAERIEQVSGALRAGPRDGGGWQITITVSAQVATEVAG